MRLNYKRLGEYIQPVEGRNTDLRNIPLMGLSINKVFIPSIANTIGTNMATYRIIKRNQFGYGPVTSRNGEKITIALFDDYDEAMISQAYVPFEVSDTEKLLPEYLMMWFRRPEFDRYARFKSHGSAREIFSWDEMQEVMLPIPHINKQREIVAEYDTIQNRIQLNEQLIQKLEETAQTIYREWFVEFEFPDENGKPYKSNGGEMVWNEELEKEIPKGWEVGTINDLKLDISDGNYSGKYPKPHEFIKSGVPFIRGVDFENKTINPKELIFISEAKHGDLKKGHLKKGDILITTRGASIGKFAYVTDEFIGKNINSQLIRINGKNEYSNFYLGCMISTETFKNLFETYSTGSAQPQLPIKNFIAIDIIIPKKNVLKEFEKFKVLLDTFLLKSQQNHKLNELKDLLLSKLATVE